MEIYYRLIAIVEDFDFMIALEKVIANDDRLDITEKVVLKDRIDYFSKQLKVI